MVKKMVVGVTSEKEEADIGRELGKLDRVSLHHIRRAEEIRGICNEVISRTEGPPSLVQITPDRLDTLRKQVQKKVKNQLRAWEGRVEISEVDIILQGAVIRRDWDSKRWKKHPPHGWAWREEVEKTGKKQREKRKSSPSSMRRTIAQVSMRSTSIEKYSLTRDEPSPS